MATVCNVALSRAEWESEIQTRSTQRPAAYLTELKEALLLFGQRHSGVGALVAKGVEAVGVCPLQDAPAVDDLPGSRTAVIEGTNWSHQGC